jgi:hypothetical protein
MRMWHDIHLGLSISIVVLGYSFKSSGYVLPHSYLFEYQVTTVIQLEAVSKTVNVAYMFLDFYPTRFI